MDLQEIIKISDGRQTDIITTVYLFSHNWPKVKSQFIIQQKCVKTSQQLQSIYKL